MVAVASQEKLELKEVLVLRLDSLPEPYEWSNVVDFLRAETGWKGTFVVLPEGDSLESLDEREMRDLGWMRVPKEG